MKNCFKKFSIMFVMSLAIIGFGMIQSGTVANAATIGQELPQAEDGWKRYEDDNSSFSYDSNAGRLYNQVAYFSGGSVTQLGPKYSGTVKFNFTGTKLRLIFRAYNYGENPIITIDGGTPVSIPCNQYDDVKVLVYSNTNLTDEEHCATITSKVNHVFDCIDIDKNGLLKPYTENISTNVSSISLNKSTNNLQVGQNENLIATTTPAGSEVVWTSSDSTIATVDSTGKVTGVKEGQATITAQIKGSETKATCVVTVTPKGTDPQPPVEPTTGDANLFIELVDGNIKSYNVSSTEITKFKQWYLDRDNTTSNKPYYEFSKGDYKDYVIHDKIDWFEVR